MSPLVSLVTQTAKKPNGVSYSYYQLRWFGSDGKRYSQSIGRTDKLSKRQAEKHRQSKEIELRQKPGLRSPGRIPSLKDFLDTYLASRRAELAAGSMELHERTAKYLKGYLGEDRRLDAITRYDAREFKTALAMGELAKLNQRVFEKVSPHTVDQHIRNARTMFNRAVDDDLIMYNPFDRMTGGLPQLDKDWHYVDMPELAKLLDACPNVSWKVFLGLCRLAGLRQGEALELQWRDVDWNKNRLNVWAQKTKRRRIVPIAPELLPLLREAFEQAPESEAKSRGQAPGDEAGLNQHASNGPSRSKPRSRREEAEFVGNRPKGESLVAYEVTAPNVWRDFGVIRKRAEVPNYAKWCHTLRKNRESDWVSAGFPFHVVVEWMGHSDEVARQHYLRVNESDVLAAAQKEIPGGLTQLLTQLVENGSPKRTQQFAQPIERQSLTNEAGEGTRTGDVQLGKQSGGKRKRPEANRLRSTPQGLTD